MTGLSPNHGCQGLFPETAVNGTDIHGAVISLTVLGVTPIPALFLNPSVAYGNAPIIPESNTSAWEFWVITSKMGECTENTHVGLTGVGEKNQLLNGDSILCLRSWDTSSHTHHKAKCFGRMHSHS